MVFCCLNRPAITFVLSALLLGAPHVSQAQSVDKTFQRWISVAGHGSVEAAPDIAHITTGVLSEAATARQAVNDNSAAMRKLIDGLKGTGIAPKDIQTQSFHVEPRYKHTKDGRSAQIDGYRVTNSLRVVVRDLKRLGETLDQVIALGANQTGGIAFTVSDAEARKDAARKLAVENATHRARLLATSAGARLGPVISIAEESASRPPRPVYAARVAKAADSVPIEEGSLSLAVRVDMTFALE